MNFGASEIDLVGGMDAFKSIIGDFHLKYCPNTVFEPEITYISACNVEQEAEEIDRYIFDKTYLLVDVRMPAEYRKMHIKGAVCIPHEYLLQRVRGLGGVIPILYCDRGGLSMQAARELQEQGYRAISVVGGIQAYRGRYLERDSR